MKIIAQSTHTMHLRRLKPRELEFKTLIADIRNANIAFQSLEYNTFYAVHNWTEKGTIFMYIGRHKNGQLHVWYRTSMQMWSSYGKNLKAAIDGAQRDGWLYA